MVFAQRSLRVSERLPNFCVTYLEHILCLRLAIQLPLGKYLAGGGVDAEGATEVVAEGVLDAIVGRVVPVARGHHQDWGGEIGAVFNHAGPEVGRSGVAR